MRACPHTYRSRDNTGDNTKLQENYRLIILTQRMGGSHKKAKN